MKHKYTTVLLLTEQPAQAKSLQIRTHWVKYFKSYLSIGSLAFFLLCFLFVFYYASSSKESQQTQQQLTLLKKQLHDKNLIDLKNNLHRVDDKIKDIEGYLKKRGAISEEVSGVGGNLNLSESNFDVDKKARFYNLYLNKLQHVLLGTPLGYPHLGSISSRFGFRANPTGGDGVEHHKGIDLKGNIGDLIKSTATGIVASAKWEGGYGNCIKIKHLSGFQTIYAHLSSTSVKQGQQVVSGQVIGKLGSTGRSTGPHLHYEIRKDDVPIDPIPFLTL